MRDRLPADHLRLIGLLDHPACPWEPRLSYAPTRRLSVDRFLAFAFSQGVALQDLEPAADEAVRRLRGWRTEHGVLPYYHVPVVPEPRGRAGARRS